VKRFVGYASNGEFSVGCTGQTVYLYDKDNNEIGKFKDIIYAYTPMISPDGTLFVVKSTDGRLAVYSLETFSLLKKFRFSKVSGAQDDGFCFSPDGKLFINIERQKDDLHYAISVYSTPDFLLVNQILLGEDMMLDHIEFDKSTNAYYVLGFMRNANCVTDRGFVAKFENNQLKNMISISENEYHFYCSYKHLEIKGFSEKAYEWSFADCELDEMKSLNHTLANIYKHYSK
jgi:WD40 repeat protein